MTDTSGYLQHLPPVLWQDELTPDGVTLGAVLRVFEKVLTGLPDDVVIDHPDEHGELHTHPSIAEEISAASRLLDPWTTPSDFLPWLASWVDLDFPTLQGTMVWDEHQRRKITAEITQTYRLRGLKSGLDRYVDLYAAGRARPRVAVDDGRRLLSLTPADGEPAATTALVSRGPVVVGSTVIAEGLIRPVCAAALPDGSLLVGDLGAPSTVPRPLRDALKSRVWHLGGDGRYPVRDARPRPVAAETMPLTAVAALAVRAGGPPAPDRLYVVDGPGTVFALTAPLLDAAPVRLGTLAAAGRKPQIAAAAVDVNGDLLVLDRGTGTAANPPHVVTVALDTFTVQRTPLRTVTTPLSLLLEQDGSLLVGDAGGQDDEGPAATGQVVRVDRSTTPWSETALIPVGSPLVAPAGLARGPRGRLFVLDGGLRPYVLDPDSGSTSTDPFLAAVAEPARVWATDMTTSPASLTPASAPGDFVYPTSLLAVGQRLIACDPGVPDVAGARPLSRIRPHEFAVAVHFARSRLDPDDDRARTEMRRAISSVRTVVDEQRPAHVFWTLVTSI